jgi:hypothetical protein
MAIMLAEETASPPDREPTSPALANHSAAASGWNKLSATKLQVSPG